MKGGLIAAIGALEAILEAGFRPLGEVQVQSVIEEEAGGGGGTLATLLKGYRADAMIKPEPGAVVTVAMAGISISACASRAARRMPAGRTGGSTRSAS